MDKTPATKTSAPKINALTGKPMGAPDTDTDLIPVLDEPKPRRFDRKTLALWLVAVSLGVFFLPLYTISLALKDDTSSMTSDLASVQKSLMLAPTAIPEVAKVLTPLAQAQGQLNQISTIYPTIMAPRPNWSSVMATIGNYDQNQIVLVSLSRSENRVTLSGQATSDAAAVSYARALEQSPLFSRVIIQSIQLITTTTVTATKMTATPTRSSSNSAAPAPSAAIPLPTPTIKLSSPVLMNTSVPVVVIVPSATPDWRDVYEPDNSQPKAIALSQPQLHTFYPDGDVDTATFLAKAQHYYRIFTADLAIGVDTVMGVQAGAISFNNDDSKPGSLYSEIVFQNTNPADVMAVITIYNRGQFGTDKSYRLIVEEVIMLATSTPTVQPTNTLTPSPTATADLRDSYEPDGTTPKPIALGEIQTHNFYPTGDIDKVSFVVKGGHYYQVLTSDLAIGVDTSVTVSLDGSQWTNDDYAAKGSNIFASAVCFQASQDGTASAAVSNMAKLYAPEKTYRIRVSEVANLNASPCLPVATPAARNSVDPTDAMRFIVWMAPHEAERMLSADAVMNVRFVIILELR